MPYAAVIFDLDGTLVDTERLMYEAGRTAFARHGAEMTPSLFASILGTDEPTGNRILAKAMPGADLSAISADWNAGIHSLYQQAIPAKPGAQDLLQRLAGADMPVAVATSSGAKGAAHKLEASGLAEFFDIVVTADDVTDRKPAPDPYLLAASRLGVVPAGCVAFEDSLPGSRSARAAGMTVVLVPDMAQIEGADVDHVAETLLEGAAKAGLP